MSTFERYLTLWVALCIVVGIALGHWFPIPFQVIGGAEVARVNLPEPEPGTPPYVALPYLDRMDYAYAAADLMVMRSGAMTVAEVGAVKVPVVYVPLAFGNGEQRLNAVGQIDSGAARMIAEQDLDPQAVRSQILPLVTDSAALAAMEAAAVASPTAHADEVLARIVLAAARKHRSRR